MKKILILFAFLVLAVLVKAQVPFPNNQSIGNATQNNLLYTINGAVKPTVGMITPSFVDTVAANNNLYIKWYDGALIKTTSPIIALWYRSLSQNKWVQILPSGGSSGGIGWLIGGNAWANDVDDLTFGGLTNNRILFKTNNTTRFILDSLGIVRSSGAANKYLTYDTITKKLYYGDGGGGTAGWGLTGNASTVAGTNFIGTTDSVDLVGKTKGLERFRWNARGALGVGTGTDFGTAGYLLSTNGSSTAPTWVNPSGIGRRFGVSGEDATAAQNRLFISSGYPFQIGALNGNKEQLFRILVDSSMGMYLRTNTSSDLAFVYLNGADSSINLKGGREVHGSGMRIADNGIFHTPYLGNFYIDTLTSAVGTKALRYNPTSGLVTYADTTAGGGTPALTATYIGYGDGSNLLTGTSGFTYDVAATTGSGLSLSSSAITSGALATFTNTGTAAASNTKKVLSIVSSGANATSTQTTYGVDISNTNTGTSSTNVALRAVASGATNNYAALFTGNVGMGTSTPVGTLHVIGNTNSNSADVDNIVSGYANNLTSGFAIRYDGLYATGSLSNVDVKLVPKGTGYVYAGGIRLLNGNANTIYFGANSANLTADAGRNIGIGSVSGASGSGVTTGINVNTTSGNVGIGTTSPTAAKLQVTGNGAASVSGGLWDGTWFTGGTATTTKPQLLIEPTGTTSTAWSTNGTGLGINAASGFTGNLIDAQVAGTSLFKVTSAGNITAQTATLGAAQVVNIVLIPDANYTVLSTDYIISCKNFSANREITLPSSPATGRVLKFVAAVSNKYSFDVSIWTADGLEIPATTLIEFLYPTTIIWDGSRWQMLNYM